jgi:hypothetical protein
MTMKTGPKILLIDIETFPDVCWMWGVYQANAIAVKEHWYILSFAYKWLGEKRVKVRGLCDYPKYKNGSDCEYHLLKEIHALFDKADIVVAHNGRAFDVKKINARLIDNGFSPPSPYKSVCTKADLKRVANFSSNRLNWLVKQLDIGEKLLEQHDWDLWQGCSEGDVGCWRRMKRYNAHDVVLLEELYNTIQAWIPQPNAALWGDGRPQCVNPACGSKHIQWRTDRHRAVTRGYRRFQCQECGAWGRATKSEKGWTAVVTGTPR